MRRCANRCEFCFIEGLPKGLRKPLYVRDDDYRLSFAYGNFATLSNVKERDIARILEYRLSPLYVSVHATPWEARKILLNNPRVPNIVEQLTRLADGRDPVPRPDGDRARASTTATSSSSRSRDLWNLGDAVLSVALVPVGVTQFSHLYTGQSDGRRERRRASSTRSSGGRRARSPSAAIAGCTAPTSCTCSPAATLPGAEHYGDFAQIENGVGAVAVAARARARGARRRCRASTASASASSPASRWRRSCRSCSTQLHAAHRRATFELIPIENSLFGPTTTTAGLLVGADIRRALAGRHDLDLALIPAETINDDGLFLDDERFIARARGAADARLSVVRLHRRARARG